MSATTIAYVKRRRTVAPCIPPNIHDGAKRAVHILQQLASRIAYQSDIAMPVDQPGNGVTKPIRQTSGTPSLRARISAGIGAVFLAAVFMSLPMQRHCETAA
ncbi:hypothetical protein [Nioella aestuarii]|uniref:hypothetical protein n=1 Tax=Nioella aestuarii TaxID=1662864 RepID=UPI003D7F937D